MTTIIIILIIANLSLFAILIGYWYAKRNTATVMPEPEVLYYTAVYTDLGYIRSFSLKPRTIPETMQLIDYYKNINSAVQGITFERYGAQIIGVIDDVYSVLFIVRSKDHLSTIQTKFEAKWHDHNKFINIYEEWIQ